MYAIHAQTYPQKMWVTRGRLRAGAAGCLLWLCVTPAFAGDAAARHFLTVEAQNDGRCQILSQGGKLVVLRNTHPDRSIHYRLVRYFMDVPQSRIVGAVAPGEEGQKLGCNRVDGRDQFWKIERADFE